MKTPAGKPLRVPQALVVFLMCQVKETCIILGSRQNQQLSKCPNFRSVFQISAFLMVRFLKGYDSILILSSPKMLPLTLHCISTDTIISRGSIPRSPVEHVARTVPVHLSGAENHHRHTQRGFAFGVSDPQLSYDPRSA